MERIDKKTLKHLLTTQSNIYCMWKPLGASKAYLHNKLLDQTVAVINFNTFMQLEKNLICERFGVREFELKKTED